MRSPLDRHHRVQLELFHPPLKTPNWSGLPPEVRQRATNLLARMLREHRARRFGPNKGKEACDE